MLYFDIERLANLLEQAKPAKTYDDPDIKREAFILNMIDNREIDFSAFTVKEIRNLFEIYDSGGESQAEEIAERYQNVEKIFDFIKDLKPRRCQNVFF